MVGLRQIEGLSGSPPGTDYTGCWGFSATETSCLKVLIVIEP